MEVWTIASTALLLIVLSCYGFGRAVLSLIAAVQVVRSRRAAAQGDLEPLTDDSHLIAHEAQGSVWLRSSQRLDWAAMLGANIAGAVIVLFGLAGVLYSGVFWVLTFVGSFLAAIHLLLVDRLVAATQEYHQQEASTIELDFDSETIGRPAIASTVAVFAGLIAAILLVVSFAPPTDGDVLPLFETPQRWLLEKRISVASDECEPCGASLMLPQTWMAWAMALGGVEAARGLGTLWAMGLAAAAARWAHLVLGPRFAVPTGCLTVAAPGVIGAAIALLPALPATAGAMMALDGLIRIRLWRSDCSVLPAIACGLLCGGSLHSQGGPSVLLIALWLLVEAGKTLPISKEPSGSSSNHGSWHIATLGAFSAAAIAMAAVLYSPLFTIGQSLDIGPLVSASLPAIAAPAPPWIGPSIVVVILLPMAIGLPPRANLRTVAVVVPVFLLLTAPRLILPGTYLPLTVVLTLPALHATQQWDQLAPAAQRWIAGATLIGLAATAAALLWHGAPAAAVACGGGREEYLLARQPHWPVAAAADRMLPADARLLTPTESAFYFRRQTISYAALLRRASEQEIRWDARLLAAQLRSAGLTHVLSVRFAPGADDDLPPAVARLNALVLQAAEGPNPWPCALDLASPDRRIRYQIWRIPD